MHERLLNQEPGIPLHQALAATLEEQIREGAWAVGSPIPPEVALCKLYSISRHTLRHALSTLEDGGLIVRRQGAPTRVISRQRPRKFTQSFNSPADILRYPKETYRVNEVEEYVECDSALASLLKVPVGSSWYHIGAVRKQQGSDLTIAWSDIYILPKFAELTSEPDHTHSMVYEQIERRFDVHIDRAEVDVYAHHLKWLRPWIFQRERLVWQLFVTTLMPTEVLLRFPLPIILKNDLSTAWNLEAS